MDGIEMICFKMISQVGAARSSYMEAIAAAKAGEFDKAKQLVEIGEQQRMNGHDVHFELLQQDSQGQSPQFSLLLMHAEDQLMSAELLKIVAEELIAVYQRLA